ncbi:MAG: hypothetical protein ABEK50_07735 [bacterium]
MGYLLTVSGLGGLAFLNHWLKWYAAHAYWFLGTALAFLGIAVYFLLYKYPSRKNRLLMGLNVGAVTVLFWYYWT